MLKKRTVILMKIETTYKTEATPSASTDAILVSNPSYSIEAARMMERENTKPDLNKDQGIYAGSLRKVSFEVENKGSGTAGTPPEFAAALKACGMAETIVVSTSVAYTEADTAIPSVTIYYYEDLLLHILTGCRGEVSGGVETGEKGTYSFEFTGHLKSTSDTPIPSAAYVSTLPAPFINAAVKIGSYGPAISKIDFALGNTVATPASASDKEGYGEIVITERDMTGSFDPEVTLLSIKNWVNEWRNGDVQILTSGVVGSKAGNRFKIDMDVYYREISSGDRDGVLTNDISCGVKELTITYT